jgi:hypothetical protein
MFVLLPIGLREVSGLQLGRRDARIVVDEEEQEFGGNVVSSIGYEARSALAVCGVPPRPSLEQL